MLFRKMEPRDKDDMQSLFDIMGEYSAGFFNKDHGNENHTMAFFRDGGVPGREYYVVEDDGHVCGYCFLWDVDSMIPWFGIAVRDDCLHRGIGTMLISETFALLRARGCGGLLLTTAQTNFRAQGLYEKCGFEKLGVCSFGEFLYLKRFQL